MGEHVCVDCKRSRWAWMEEMFTGDSRPELFCTKPAARDLTTGELVLPVTHAARIREGYGPPMAKASHFYPWECEFEPAGFRKEEPKGMGVMARMSGAFRGEDVGGLGPEMGVLAYAKSLGATVSR